MPPPVAERLLACGRGHGDALACWEKKLTLGRQPSHACLGRRPNGLYVVRNAPFRTVKRAVLQVKTCVFATCCRPAGCAGCPGLRNVFTEKAACRIGPVGGSRHRHPACRLVTSRPGKPFTEQAGHLHGNSFLPLRPAMCVNGKKRQPPRRASRCGGCFTSLPGGNHNLSSCTVKWRIIGASHAMRTPLVTCSRRS